MKGKNDDMLNIEDLINKYNHYLYTVISNMSRGKLSNEDIEEILSDAFFLAWKNLDKINSNSVKEYLSEIARNLTKNKFRSINSKDNHLDTFTPEDFQYIENEISNSNYSNSSYNTSSTSIDEVLDNKEKMKIVNDTLETLPECDRNIFINFYFYNNSIKQISKLYNLSEINVRVKLHRVKSKLKESLKKRGFNYGK